MASLLAGPSRGMGRFIRLEQRIALTYRLQTSLPSDLHTALDRDCGPWFSRAAAKDEHSFCARTFSLSTNNFKRVVRNHAPVSGCMCTALQCDTSCICIDLCFRGCRGE